MSRQRCKDASACYAGKRAFCAHCGLRRSRMFCNGLRPMFALRLPMALGRTSAPSCAFRPDVGVCKQREVRLEPRFAASTGCLVGWPAAGLLDGEHSSCGAAYLLCIRCVSVEDDSSGASSRRHLLGSDAQELLVSEWTVGPDCWWSIGVNVLRNSQLALW